jgi:hypothetical protein
VRTISEIEVRFSRSRPSVRYDDVLTKPAVIRGEVGLAIA